MLKRFSRQAMLAVAVALPMVFSPMAHAQDEYQPSKDETKLICTGLSYIAYQAMSERQAGSSEKKATQNLYKEFVETSDKESKEFFKNVVDMTIKDAYSLPILKTAEEKENASMELSVGVFSGCVEEFGYSLSDFKNK